MVMLKTFRAWLRDSHLDWIDEVPEFGEQLLQVQVMLVDHKPTSEVQARGRRMAEVLEKLATTNLLGDTDPGLWQQATREDRSLPGW
jgi:hypothetical protein